MVYLSINQSYPISAMLFFLTICSDVGVTCPNCNWIKFIKEISFVDSTSHWDLKSIEKRVSLRAFHNIIDNAN